MEIARCHAGRDRSAVERIWQDIGWVDLQNERHVGVRPATGLAAVTDDLSGPQELLCALDTAFRLPAPGWDWQF